MEGIPRSPSAQDRLFERAEDSPTLGPVVLQQEQRSRVLNEVRRKSTSRLQQSSVQFGNTMMEALAPPPLSSAVPATSTPAITDEEFHILIIGAGITGLALAQALRKRNQENPSRKPITFSIYERDAYALARGAGWGLTLH